MGLRAPARLLRQKCCALRCALRNAGWGQGEMVDSFVAREDLVMGMLVNTVIPQVDMVIMA